MTVIVAVSGGSRVCMASDSLAVNNGAKGVLKTPKLVRMGTFVIGSSGSFGANQLLPACLKEPFTDPRPLLDVCKQLADDLRKELKDRDLMRRVNDALEFPGMMLVARGPDFALIDAGGSVIQFDYDWWAIGSGAAEARGAMFVASKYEHAGADEVARAGVEAAIALDDGCGGDIRMEWTT